SWQHHQPLLQSALPGVSSLYKKVESVPGKSLALNALRRCIFLICCQITYIMHWKSGTSGHQLSASITVLYAAVADLKIKQIY
ncbi:hypothetical protein QMS66_08695, partial [Cronobacter sakazakii]